MANRPLTRFAPSPTGFLHRGHAASALAVWREAQALGAAVLLRIEDIDRTRCRADYEQAIGEDLAWLGLTWPAPVRRQSEHMADYEAALDRLRADGLLYRCFRTRKEVLDEIARAPHGPQEVFRGRALAGAEEARRLEAGEPFAWRLSLGAAHDRLGADWDRLTYTDLDEGALPATPEVAGDVVLARKDVGVAYHLASVVDDGLQGITHVVRGEDLREAAHVHRLLQVLLDLPSVAYRHHPLVLGPDGLRLAKRNGAESLRDLRAQGWTPGAVIASIS